MATIPTQPRPPLRESLAPHAHPPPMRVPLRPFHEIFGPGMKQASSPLSRPPPSGVVNPDSQAPNRPVQGQARDRPDDQPALDRELDPLVRRAAHWAPPTAFPVLAEPNVPVRTGEAAANATTARLSLEELLPSLVRKVAWSGDSKRGTMRMELGSGSLAGGTLIVHADQGRVRVELDAPAGANVREWRERIHDRLTQHGILVESVEVR